jgi:predicted Holliday junction resolvase-like endonuclease
MAGGSMVITILLGVVAVLLVATVVVLASIAAQLKVLRHEAEIARTQLAKMDWTQLIFNAVQHLKEAGHALDTIDKRLQKLEALEKVQLSHINIRAGR